MAYREGRLPSFFLAKRIPVACSGRIRSAPGSLSQNARACRRAPGALCPGNGRGGRFGVRTPSEPMLNVPPVVTALLVAFGVIHAVRAFVLSPPGYFELLLLLSLFSGGYA